jgi:hypothetical protein
MCSLFLSSCVFAVMSVMLLFYIWYTLVACVCVCGGGVAYHTAYTPDISANIPDDDPMWPKHLVNTCENME